MKPIATASTQALTSAMIRRLDQCRRRAMTSSTAAVR